MLSKKYFILLFLYDYIHLFTEVDGKITRIKFSGNREKLSNCVTFSYTKEDLEFLPDGDPFDVNSNSSFSDYLDFAGYHFDPYQAVEEIVSSMIKNKMIPNLGKNDDIYVCTQTFYFESNNRDGDTTEKAVESASNVELPSMILGHHIYSYDFFGLLMSSIERMKKIINRNLIVGYPFLTLLMYDTDDGLNASFAPTLERTVVKDINEKYPLPKHIPAKLLRNVRNRIIVSKLFNLPLPEHAYFQNRKIDLAKTQLAKRFDSIIKGDCDLFLEKTKDIKGKDVFIYDFGMYPVIKDTFLSLVNKSTFIEKKENDKFMCFILRNMVVQQTMKEDCAFVALAVKMGPLFEGSPVFYPIDGMRYYELQFINFYIKSSGKKNILSNIETKQLEASIEAADMSLKEAND